MIRALILCAALTFLAPSLNVHGASPAPLTLAPLTLAPLIYGPLTPLGQSAPQLASALAILEAGGDSSKASDLLKEWASAPPASDPWIRDLGHVLEAWSAWTQGGADEAKRRLKAHIKEGRAHRDLAHRVLMDLAIAQGAAARRLTHAAAQSRGLERHTDDIIAAAQALPKRLDAARALEAHLRGPLTADARLRTVLAAADLYKKAKKKTAAKQLLYRAWWAAGLTAHQTILADALATLKARPGFGATTARTVLQGSKRATTKMLRKARPRTRYQRRVIAWAKAVRGRDSAKTRPKSRRTLKKLRRHFKTSEFEPFILMGQAMVLRKMDLDDIAATVYADLAARHPHHPLAAEALAESAALRAWVGEYAHALKLARSVADLKAYGSGPRDALWRVALDALVDGRNADAIAPLNALEMAYAGERDGLGVTWQARVLYWRGRAYAKTGKGVAAQRDFDSLRLRYPMGWYAGLLKRDTSEATPSLQDPMVSEPIEDGPESAPLVLDAKAVAQRLLAAPIVRRPVLDPILLSLRRGHRKTARRQLFQLLTAGHLSGAERTLLAGLLAEGGRLEDAQDLLVRGGVVAEDLTPEMAARYGSLYRLAFRPILEEQALKNQVAPAFFAALIHIESRFNPTVVSGPGAIGLCQLMPKTAAAIGKKLLGRKVTRKGLRDPETNMAVGARLIRELLTTFRGHAPLALAGFNAGRGAARGWMRRRGHLPTDLFVELIPFGQARRYIMRVTAVARAYSALYGLTAPPALAPRLPLTVGPFMVPTAADDSDSNPAPSE